MANYQPNIWLVVFLLFGSIDYTLNHQAVLQSSSILILIASILLGKLASKWSVHDIAFRLNKHKMLLSSIMVIVIVILTSFWHSGLPKEFQYQNQTRWHGPWDNPNIFGLLMGTGVALAAGWLVHILNSDTQNSKAVIGNWKIEVRKYPILTLCFIAVILMALGLLFSYSRGAWLGTFCGLTYLAICEFKIHRSKFCGWLNSKRFSLIVIALSISFLITYHFQRTDWHIAQRVLSTINVVDFSWRNRVEAWEGALQIMAEHPFCGDGWNQPETLYDHYYLSPKLSESAAIEMNDYLVLGATLGMPALFCFGLYLWLSFTKQSEIGSRKSEIVDVNRLQMTCHAGAIVLLVGFWFDGGLFKFSTAATFWILLELGAAKVPHTHENLRINLK
jgi:hypothetical protein